MTRQIEIVLPLRPDNGVRGSDLLRAAEGLIPSFNRFCDPGLIARFTVVVPPGQEHLLAPLHTASAIDLTVVAETALLTPPPSMPRHGWYLQQMLKMAYAGWCRTPFYLTLDADVVLLDRLDAAVLADGRAPIQLETAGLHPEWWQGSASALGRPPVLLQSNAPVMGVTPAFLSAAVMRAAIGRLVVLAECRRQDWPDYLAALATDGHSGNTWTEYGLYWTELSSGSGVAAIHCPRCVYAFCHAAEEALRKLRVGTGDAALFGVIQSSYVSAAAHVACVRRLLATTGSAA